MDLKNVRLELVEKILRKKWGSREERLASSKDFKRILISSHLCDFAGRRRGRESRGGTCRRASAKGPIITSKPDSTGNGLGDTGAPYRG